MNMNTLTLGVGVGIVIGAVPTYFITKKLITKAIQERADQDIADVTERFQKLHKVGPYADPTSLIQELGYVTADTEDKTYEETVAELQLPEKVEDASADDVEGVTPPKLPVPSDVPPRRNLFDEADRLEENITQAEIEARSPEFPYIITAEEWADNNSTFEKITLTYYSDGTLADDHDKPVEEPDTLVGEEHLSMFGKYSRDREIVYVRNEKNDAEFEIVRDEREYITMMNEQ